MKQIPAINPTSPSARFLLKRSLILLLLAVLFLSCSDNRPEVIHDLSKASFEVVNQDSTRLNFPQDFKGSFSVVGFIYTNCPDVCPIITANLKNISRQAPESSEIQFIGITFDPERDSPSVLKNYMQRFDLNTTQFTMLTAETVTMDSLLASMDIKAEKLPTSEMSGQKHANHTGYMMNHTNRILVMDPDGKVRFEYPGSVVPPDMVLEDIGTLQ